MRFTKMHGIGNDYVYLNGFEVQVNDPSTLAIQIANRHTGVGGDGLILVLPPDEGVNAHVRMRMFNADGSESQMCGNGIRCVCKFAHDRKLTTANPMRIQTDRGVLTLQYTLDTAGLVEQIRVNMGAPILTPAEIPVALPQPQTDPMVNYPMENLVDWSQTPAGEDWITQCQLDPRMTGVSMGNPHIMLYCQDVSKVPLEQVGPILENHTIFPERMNIHFVQIHSRSEVTMRTWERGSGITQACGTGASAVCVAGVLTGQTDSEILAHLPGGDLTLQWDSDSNHKEVYMTGPATEVFTGDWPD